MPIGVASISFDMCECPLPVSSGHASAALSRELPASKPGRSGFPESASSFPEPDTPVTTVSLPFRNLDLQRLDRMDRDPVDIRIVSLIENSSCCRCTGSSYWTYPGRSAAGRSGPNHGMHWIRLLNFLSHVPSCDHVAAICSGFRTHLNDPVRFRKDLRIVIYQQYGISIRDQIVHHTVSVRRYWTDAVRSTAHPAHTAPRSCGFVTARASCIRWRSPVDKRRCRAIQCQIAKPQIQ